MRHFSAAGVLSALVAASCAPPQTIVNNQPPALGAPLHGITVEGFGEASGPPNIARVSVGVESRAASPDQAVNEANARMAQILAAIKQLGVANQDLRTSQLALHYERFAEPPPRPVEEPVPSKGRGSAAQPAPAPAPPPPQPAGAYRASNMVEVTIRNLDQAGRVLSAATSAGANQVFGVQFEIEDPTLLEQEARIKAFADAKNKAARLAELAGKRLGPAQSITESRGGGGWGPRAAMMRAEAGEVPVERGELKVGMTVQVVFALE
jgi:uncharacterized protein YggE